MHTGNGHAGTTHTISRLNGSAPSARTRRGLHGEPWRVAIVIPGYQRREDLEKLFLDISRLDLRGITLWSVLVDNNSPTPLNTIAIPANCRVEHYRLDKNTGGAGGFSAGMARVMSGEGLTGEFDIPDFLWLLDSDVRVAKRSLRELIKAAIKHKNYCAFGSALVDIVTQTTYEIGGRMNPKNGFFVPSAMGDVDKRKIIPAEYLAACSTLVRYDALKKTGLMPDIFIHGDDVEWCLQMTRKTGMKVGGVPSSKAYHPLWSRKFQTWVRYYTTRNAYAPIDVCGFGPKTRFRRAGVDVLRAIGQVFTGMDELAELHLVGLEHAAQCKTEGHEIPGGMMKIIQSTKMKPYAELAAAVQAEAAKFEQREGRKPTIYVHPLMALRSQDLPGLKEQLATLNQLPPKGWNKSQDWLYWHHRSLGSHMKSDMVKGLLRALFAKKADIAILPTGRPTSWFRATHNFLLTNDGWQLRTVETGDALKKGTHAFIRGLKAMIGLYRRPRTFHNLRPVPDRVPTAGAKNFRSVEVKPAATVAAT